MNFDKTFQLWEGVTRPGDRAVLNNIRVYARYELDQFIAPRWPSATAVVTNGFFLACVPVELGDDEFPGLVPADAWKEAAKQCGRNKFGTCAIDMSKPDSLVLRNGVMYDRPSENEIGHFPNWRPLLDTVYDANKEHSSLERPDPGVALHPGVAFDIQELVSLAKCLGLYDKSTVKGLRIIHRAAKWGDPLIVEGTSVYPGGYVAPPFGLLMPVADTQVKARFYHQNGGRGPHVAIL